MEQLGIRALRNHLAAVVRRAGSGETLVITVDGVPTATIGPVGATRSSDLSSLLALGLVTPPQANPSLRAPEHEPVMLAADVRIDDVLGELRG